MTLEVHLVQESGLAFLARGNRLLVNACVPSGHVSVGFPSLVLSVPLLSQVSFLLQKCRLIFSLSTYEEVQMRTSENNLCAGRKQTIYHICGSQDLYTPLLNSTFLHT